MSERTDADKLAERLLDEPNCDPDDNLHMLSRQLLRRRETIDRLEKHLIEMQDGTMDLINANRDIVLRIHEEGIRRIRKVLDKSPSDCEMAQRIISALNLFHPMHGESWCGWPEGS